MAPIQLSTRTRDPQAITADIFSRWFTRKLLPQLRRGDIVVMDNAKPHKDPRVVRAAKRKGIKVRFLPPYSPDFSPIEPAWAVAKKYIRAVAPRQDNALRRVAHRAFRRIGWKQCHAWFAHSGFRCRLK